MTTAQWQTAIDYIEQLPADERKAVWDTVIELNNITGRKGVRTALLAVLFVGHELAHQQDPL